MFGLMQGAHQGGGASTPYSFVQGQFFGNVASGAATTLASNATAGNAIIVSAQFGVSGTPIVTDDKGNTYSLIKLQGSGGGFVAIWAAFNVASGATNITLTLAGATFDGTFCEYSGLVSADQTAGAGPTSGANASSGATSTTTQANEMVFGVTTYNNNQPTAGSGFTRRAFGVYNVYVTTEDKRVISTGNYSADFTSASGTFICVCATFKEA